MVYNIHTYIYTYNTQTYILSQVNIHAHTYIHTYVYMHIYTHNYNIHAHIYNITHSKICVEHTISMSIYVYMCK